MEPVENSKEQIPPPRGATGVLPSGPHGESAKGNLRGPPLDWRDMLGVYMHEGMAIPKLVHVEDVDRLRAFNFDKDDVLISTYPRSGTTWSQEMTWLVCNNADVDMASKVRLEARSRFIEFRLPHLDATRKPDIELLENDQPPRVIKTHLTPEFFETKRREVQFKTIIVMRNLKDVLVSHFHFYQDLFNFKESWDTFFEMFKQDKILSGSWVKHNLQCWELRNDPNVLILKYEDMKRDPAESIRRIAYFCGKTLNEDQVASIVDYTLVGNMRKLHLSSTIRENPDPKQERFIRKGVVGDWKEWFSNEQSKYVAEILRATTEKEGLVFEDKPV